MATSTQSASLDDVSRLLGAEPLQDPSTANIAVLVSNEDGLAHMAFVAHSVHKVPKAEGAYEIGIVGTVPKRELGMESKNGELAYNPKFYTVPVAGESYRAVPYQVENPGSSSLFLRDILKVLEAGPLPKVESDRWSAVNQPV